jgi:LmbE family N-acetylglucosaminyl deacetylase
MSLRVRLKSLYHNLKISAFQKFILNSRSQYLDFDGGTVLIIAPHPDDEIFGLGGFLLDQSQKNSKITLVYLTDGEASLPDIPKDDIVKARINISSAVLKEISGADFKVFRLHLPDGQVPFSNDLLYNTGLECIKEIITGVQPGAVFVTHPGDFWPYDHVAAFELVKQALHELNFTGKLYGYWVWLWYNYSSRNFKNIGWKNTYKIPIHSFMAKKKELIGMYMNPVAPNEKPYSGVMPEAFFAAFAFPYEMVTEFKIKPDVGD